MKKFHLLLLLVFIIPLANAQNCDDAKVTIKMLKTKDGTTIFGEFVSGNDSTVTINSNSLGTINILLSQLSSNNDVVCSRIKNGEYWFENPSSNYSFVAPSAFALEKGSFYYRNSFLFFNLIGYGFTSNFSISAGFDFLTLFKNDSYFNQDRHAAFMIMPQYSIQAMENLRIGTSFIFLSDDGNFISPQSYKLDRYGDFYTEEEKTKSTGIHLLQVSYGDGDKNLGFNLGYQVFGYKHLSDQIYASITGFYRVSNRFGLQLEYEHYRPEFRDDAVAYGLKFITRKMAIDFGFIAQRKFAEPFAIGIPFVSFTIKP